MCVFDMIKKISKFISLQIYFSVVLNGDKLCLSGWFYCDCESAYFVVRKGIHSKLEKAKTGISHTF